MPFCKLACIMNAQGIVNPYGVTAAYWRIGSLYNYTSELIFFMGANNYLYLEKKIM